ncbi:MAG: glycosyltransferase family 2 protein [Fibrobacterota bacterium]
MKLSVLVQCYNHEPYLEEAVRSVYAQDLTGTEVIVVDDGSSDNSAELLKRLHEELGFELILQQNRGFIPTLNELLQKARGEYLCLLAGDDFYPEGKFSQQVEYLDSHPECSVLLGNSLVVGSDSKVLRKQNQLFVIENDRELSFEEVFLGHRRVGGASSMFRKSALQEINAFPPDVLVEDLWAWLKLLSGGHRIVWLNRNWAYYRLHDSNINQRSLLMQEKILEILEEYRDHPLFERAMRFWKSAFFSQLAINDKRWALNHFFHYFSLHPHFLIGCLKLIFPAKLFRKLRKQW